jgi:hypothetical protein
MPNEGKCSKCPRAKLEKYEAAFGKETIQKEDGRSTKNT